MPLPADNHTPATSTTSSPPEWWGQTDALPAADEDWAAVASLLCRAAYGAIKEYAATAGQKATARRKGQ